MVHVRMFWGPNSCLGTDMLSLQKKSYMLCKHHPPYIRQTSRKNIPVINPGYTQMHREVNGVRWEMCTTYDIRKKQVCLKSVTPMNKWYATRYNEKFQVLRSYLYRLTTVVSVHFVRRRFARTGQKEVVHYQLQCRLSSKVIKQFHARFHARLHVPARTPPLAPPSRSSLVRRLSNHVGAEKSLCIIYILVMTYIKGAARALDA